MPAWKQVPVGRRLQVLEQHTKLPPVELKVLQQPSQVINVGLASFNESLAAHDAGVFHVDWRPAAGGNEKMMAIWERMKKKG